MSGDSSELLDFVASMAGEGTLRVEESLGAGFVRLRVAEAERRQAKHDIRSVEDAVIEMLRNSRDASARHIYLATTRDADIRSLVILDDGDGIPEDMCDRIFEARVTSKLDSMHMDRWGVHGRGMALYSIKENAVDARVMDSVVGAGSSVRVLFDTTELTERADQSSWPSIGTDDDGNQAPVRGPHNIIRTCCEFALESRADLDVWVGSPAEILATIRTRRPSIPESKLVFVSNLSELPILDRIVVAADASELCSCAETLGISISERTAHRILAGQIKPVRSVASRLTHSSDTKRRSVDLTHDSRGLKVSRDDIDAFARIMERDFRYLAERYYLELDDDPRVRVSRDKIVVSFDLKKLD